MQWVGGGPAGALLRARLVQRGGDKAAFRLAGHWHLRQRGWMVRSGAQMGGDFVVYQKHPEESHSSHVVMTMPCDREGNALDAGGGPPPFEGMSMHAHVRLATAVRKKLLILYVCSGDRDGMGSRDWVLRCRVLEVVAHREPHRVPKIAPP